MKRYKICFYVGESYHEFEFFSKSVRGTKGNIADAHRKALKLYGNKVASWIDWQEYKNARLSIYLED